MMNEHSPKSPESIRSATHEKEAAYQERVTSWLNMRCSELLQKVQEQGGGKYDFQTLATNAVNQKLGPGKRQERFAGFDAIKAALAEIQLQLPDEDFEENFSVLAQIQKFYPEVARQEAVQPLFDMATAKHALELHELTEKVKRTGFEAQDLNQLMGLTENYKQYYTPVQEQIRQPENYHLSNKLVVRLRTPAAEDAARKAEENEAEYDELLQPYVLPSRADRYPPPSAWEKLAGSELPQEVVAEAAKNGWEIERNIIAYYRGSKNEPRQEVFIKFALIDKQTGTVHRVYFGSDEARQEFYWKLYGRSYNRRYITKEGEYETYEARLRELRNWGFEKLRWHKESREELKTFAEKRGWHTEELQELVHEYAYTTDFGRYQLLKHIQSFTRFHRIALAEELEKLIEERDVDAILAQIGLIVPSTPDFEITIKNQTVDEMLKFIDARPDESPEIKEKYKQSAIIDKAIDDFHFEDLTGQVYRGEYPGEQFVSEAIQAGYTEQELADALWIHKKFDDGSENFSEQGMLKQSYPPQDPTVLIPFYDYNDPEYAIMLSRRRMLKQKAIEEGKYRSGEKDYSRKEERELDATVYTLGWNLQPSLEYIQTHHQEFFQKFDEEAFKQLPGEERRKRAQEYVAAFMETLPKDLQSLIITEGEYKVGITQLILHKHLPGTYIAGIPGITEITEELIKACSARAIGVTLLLDRDDPFSSSLFRGLHDKTDSETAQVSIGLDLREEELENVSVIDWNAFLHSAGISPEKFHKKIGIDDFFLTNVFAGTKQEENFDNWEKWIEKGIELITTAKSLIDFYHLYGIDTERIQRKAQEEGKPFSEAAPAYKKMPGFFDISFMEMRKREQRARQALLKSQTVIARGGTIDEHNRALLTLQHELLDLGIKHLLHEYRVPNVAYPAPYRYSIEQGKIAHLEELDKHMYATDETGQRQDCFTKNIRENGMPMPGVVFPLVHPEVLTDKRYHETFFIDKPAPRSEEEIQDITAALQTETLETVQKKYLDDLRDVILGFGIEFSLPQNKTVTYKGEPVRQPESKRVLTQSRAVELFKQDKLTVEVTEPIWKQKPQYDKKGRLVREGIMKTENFLPLYNREEQTISTAEIIRRSLRAAEKHREQPKEPLVFPVDKEIIVSLRETELKLMRETIKKDPFLKKFLVSLIKGYQEFHQGEELSEEKAAHYFKTCPISELYSCLGAATLRAHFADKKEYEILRHGACVETTGDEGAQTRLKIPLIVRKRKEENPYPLCYAVPIVEISERLNETVDRSRAIFTAQRNIAVLEDYLNGTDTNPEAVENKKYHRVIETLTQKYEELPDKENREEHIRRLLEGRLRADLDTAVLKTVGLMLIRKEDNAQAVSKNARAEEPFFSVLKRTLRREAALMERSIDGGIFEETERSTVEPALTKEAEGDVILILIKDGSGKRFIGMRKIALSELQKKHPHADGVYGVKGPSREVEFQAHIYGNLQTARQRDKEIWIMPEFDALAFYLQNNGEKTVLGMQNQYDCGEDILNIIAQIGKIHITLPPEDTVDFDRIYKNAERLVDKIQKRTATLNKEREKRAKETGKAFPPLPEPVIAIE